MEQQLKGIELFTVARKQAVAAAARSREVRTRSARRQELLRRQHEALVARTQEHLRRSVDLLRSTTPRTVLLGHRDEWFLDEVTRELRDNGFQVVGRLHDGAEVIGVSVAEQPDLVLVEDTLAVPGEQLVREVLRYSPGSRVVAQVGREDRARAFLAAGACAVHSRQEPPAEVVAAVLRLQLV